MKVTLIASTALTTCDLPYDFEIEQKMPPPDPDVSQDQLCLFDEYVNDTDQELLIEFAGRLCYESFDRPNARTSKNADYMANIISQGHHSVLEHASASFLIEGVSRSLTHELVRHRHLSYSQVSQRYVDHSNASTKPIILPPVVRDLLPSAASMSGASASVLIETALEDLDNRARLVYDEIVTSLIAVGKTRKEARGAARAALLESTSTSLVVTGNHRAWRDVISKRNSNAADQEIRELAQELLRHLRVLAPSVYADFA